MQRDAAQYEEFAQREAHFEKAQHEARFATFIARDAESLAAIWRLCAEEPVYSFAWSARQQASGPGRGLPQPTVLDGVILDHEQQKEQAKCAD